MSPTSRAARLVLLAVVFVLAACVGAPPADPSATPAPPTASPSAPGSPDPSVAPSPSPTPQPTVAPSPTPVPTPKPPAVWSKPIKIASGQCWNASMTIDSTGRYHVVAVCDDEIIYLTSPDGTAWDEDSFPRPKDRVELGPQIAVDGATVHLAYSRLALEDGGCGDDGYRDLGIYERTRQLPNGAWSDPVRLGAEGDSLQAFRVVDGVRHLTANAKEDAPTVYLRVAADGTTTRVVLSDAIATSLRIGDDGRARIAYTTGSSLKLAVIRGTSFDAQTLVTVKGTYIVSPLLVLGAGNRPVVMWSQTTDDGGGCASPGPGPSDGTYVGVLGSGGWHGERISTSLGITSVTLDASGAIAALIAEQSMTLFSSNDGDDWDSAPLAGTKNLTDPVIRIDPATGTTAILGVDFDRGIYLLTKPAG